MGKKRMSLIQLYDNYLNRKRDEFRKKEEVLRESARFECGHMKDTVLKTFEKHTLGNDTITYSNYDENKTKNISSLSKDEQSKLCNQEIDELNKCFSGMKDIEVSILMDKRTYTKSVEIHTHSLEKNENAYKTTINVYHA